MVLLNVVFAVLIYSDIHCLVINLLYFHKNEILYKLLMSDYEIDIFYCTTQCYTIHGKNTICCNNSLRSGLISNECSKHVTCLCVDWPWPRRTLQTIWWPSAKRANFCRTRWRPRSTTSRTCEHLASRPPLSPARYRYRHRHSHLTSATTAVTDTSRHLYLTLRKILALFQWRVAIFCSILFFTKWRGRRREVGGRLDVSRFRVIASRFLL